MKQGAQRVVAMKLEKDVVITHKEKEASQKAGVAIKQEPLQVLEAAPETENKTLCAPEEQQVNADQENLSGYISHGSYAEDPDHGETSCEESEGSQSSGMESEGTFDYYDEMMGYNFGDAALEEMLTRSGCRNIKKFSERTDKRVARFLEKIVKLPTSVKEGSAEARIAITKDWQNRIMEEGKGMKSWTASLNMAIEEHVKANKVKEEEDNKILHDHIVQERATKSYYDGNNTKITPMTAKTKRSMWKPSIIQKGESYTPIEGPYMLAKYRCSVVNVNVNVGVEAKGDGGGVRVNVVPSPLPHVAGKVEGSLTGQTEGQLGTGVIKSTRS